MNAERLMQLARTLLLTYGQRDQDGCWEYFDRKVLIVGDAFGTVTGVSCRSAIGYKFVYEPLNRTHPVKNETLLPEAIDHMERVLVLEELGSCDNTGAEDQGLRSAHPE